jgi:predicted transcriptional regulator
MTVKELVFASDFNEISVSVPEKEVKGVYIGDLLSWVMGNASASNVWITIMSNINTVAVATLADVSCILLAEGVVPDDDMINVAKAKGVNILSTNLPAYEAAIKIHGILN